MKCKNCGETIVKHLDKWEHPRFIDSIGCLNPEPGEE